VEHRGTGEAERHMARAELTRDHFVEASSCVLFDLPLGVNSTPL
jgi:hypothetical protein